MSDETHEVDEQLFDTDQNEVADDATDTEDDSNESQENSDENTESEQEQEGLDLEDKTPSKAEEIKLKQIKAWQDKIDRGEVTLDKIPKAQSWLKKYLSTPEQEVDHKEIAKEIAREAIREERAELQFADLKDTLNSIKLSKEQKSIIQEKYKLFREKGISPFEALSFATEFAKVDFTGLSEKRRRMGIPQPSTKKPTGEIDWEQPFSELVKNVPQEKINEHLKSLVK